MDPQAVRRGKNEAVFRNVNERLEELNETFGAVTGEYEIVCECGNAECAQHIRLDAAKYERIRDDATLFIVIPGHESAALETVVERNDEYEVIRKNRGAPERIARATDPRA